MKRSRRASAVACDVVRVGPVLPITRSPSTKQTSIRAALVGSTPAASSPATFTRENAPAALVSIALKKLRMRPLTSAVVASQFHGCGHQQASAPTTGAARAVDVTSKERPQAINRRVARDRVRRLSAPERRRYSDRAHAGRARACPRRRHKGCHAKASSLEASLEAPCRDSRVTKTHPWHARQRLPCRNYGAGHAATALGFGVSQLCTYIDRSVLNCKWQPQNLSRVFSTAARPRTASITRAPSRSRTRRPTGPQPSSRRRLAKTGPAHTCTVAAPQLRPARALTGISGRRPSAPDSASPRHRLQ